MEFIKPGPNKRVCAFLIDIIILDIFAVLMTMVFSKNLNWIIASLGILLRDCYQGQSIGRRVVGIQVIDYEGQVAPPGLTIWRNLLMIIPLFPIIEYFVMLNDKKNGQRLGDLWAKTRITDLKPEIPDSRFFKISLVIYVGLIIFIFIAAMLNTWTLMHHMQ